MRAEEVEVEEVEEVGLPPLPEEYTEPAVVLGERGLPLLTPLVAAAAAAAALAPSLPPTSRNARGKEGGSRGEWPYSMRK